MSAQTVAPVEHVCYVHCNFCSTVLAQEHLQENIRPQGTINGTSRDQFDHLEFGSSSSAKFRLPMMYSAQNDLLQEQALAARAPEKRQRVPSAYNRFIKEEIRRIKANNPDISHREAFSTAAKNWAHYPNIHFGLSSPGREGGKKLVDETVAAVTTPAPTNKIQGFY